MTDENGRNFFYSWVLSAFFSLVEQYKETTLFSFKQYHKVLVFGVKLRIIPYYFMRRDEHGAY